MMYKFNIKSNNHEKVMEFIDKNEDVELLGYYDIEERLEKQVASLGSALEELKKGGISMEVLRNYLKGRGVSIKVQNAVMGELDNFFKDVGYYKDEN